MDNKNKKQDPDHIIIDMPEVKDIPGQEHVKPPRIREMEDDTIASAGEEGVGIVDDLNTDRDDTVMDDGTNVSRTEKRMLKKTEQTENEETEDLSRVKLDNTDGEDILNQTADAMDFGEDLDVPGSELDDASEDIGAEDEENNSYSGRD